MSAGPVGQQARLGWPVWRLALVIVFGAFTSGLDSALVTIGLDTIGADLDADLSAVQWIASGYLLALAVSLPPAAWLGRRIGVGRLWIGALAAFVVASGLCALAPDVGSLIALRVMQGLAGGLLIPAGQTVLGQAVGAHRLGRVMATLGIAVTLAPALGPVVGALVIDAGSWRWLFAVNAPIGIVGILLGLRYVPRGARASTARLDTLGLLLISSALPLVVLGLTEWGDRRTLLAPTALGPLAAGLGVLVWFAVHARRRRDPLIDLTLLRGRVFAAAVVASGFGGVLMFGSALLFPLYLQLGRGDSVVDTGVRMLGLGLATAAALPFVGRLVDRHGGGIVAAAGSALTLAATIPFALLPLDADGLLVEALLLLVGIGVAFAAGPPGIAAFAAVAHPQMGDATTIVGIVSRLGGAVGSAVLTVVVATGSATGVPTAFHTAFGLMAAAAALALGAAVLLTATQRPPPMIDGRSS